MPASMPAAIADRTVSRSGTATLGDWEDVPLKARRLNVCFDSDTIEKPGVAQAMRRFGKWLKSKQAEARYIVTPSTAGGKPVKGVDDYLAAGGTVEKLLAAATTRPPDAPRSNAADEFSDAQLGQMFADEVLEHAFNWSAGLGWMRYHRGRWEPTADVEVTGAAVQWVMDKYAEAAQAAADAAKAGKGNDAVKAAKEIADEWYGCQSAARISAFVRLATPHVLVRGEDFDHNPDIMNAPNGVIDLTTGELLPHDPGLLLTKMTGAAYKPGAAHPDWDAALEAVPEDIRDWYQQRLGQAITGHLTPDDVLLVQQGDGENGKTTVMTGCSGAFGDYYLVVAERALLADPSAHPDEIAAFRGARFAVLEELPEDRRLAVARLKRLVGTTRISARQIREKTMVFDCTHSLIVSTNYYLLITETDRGTWRRLLLVPFPYTWCKRAGQIRGPGDRLGDPGLRDRMKRGKAQQEAVLAWAVEGARKWYAADRVLPPPPDRVEKATRDWRKASDLVLAYLDEAIMFDAAAHVMSTELLQDFNRFLQERGHQKWTEKTLASRLMSHEEIQANHVEAGRKYARDDGLSRPVLEPWMNYTSPPHRFRAWLGLRFRTAADDKDDEAREDTDEAGGNTPASGFDLGICALGTAGTASSVNSKIGSHVRDQPGLLSLPSQTDSGRDPDPPPQIRPIPVPENEEDLMSGYTIANLSTGGAEFPHPVPVRPCLKCGTLQVYLERLSRAACPKCNYSEIAWARVQDKLPKPGPVSA